MIKGNQLLPEKRLTWIRLKGELFTSLTRLSLDAFDLFEFYFYSFASSINYIALKNSPSILMTWTERNVNNQTRCGIVKYTMRTPTFDKIVDIFDYSYLQHDINTLYELNGKNKFHFIFFFNKFFFEIIHLYFVFVRFPYCWMW